MGNQRLGGSGELGLVAAFVEHAPLRTAGIERVEDHVARCIVEVLDEAAGEIEHHGPLPLAPGLLEHIRKCDGLAHPGCPDQHCVALFKPPGIGDRGQMRGLVRERAGEFARLALLEHGGQVPRTREALEALPGVGRKTANVVLNVAFGEPTMAVDTHIFRVGNRTGLAPGKTPDKVEQQLLQRVPAPYLVDAHHWLILHGRYVCKARKPLCEGCVIADLCEYPARTSQMPAPLPDAAD